MPDRDDPEVLVVEERVAQDFVSLKSGLMVQSPMFRLYDAIEGQLGRHRNSELVPVKMSFRDWNRISRTLEMMFGLHSDD